MYIGFPSLDILFFQAPLMRSGNRIVFLFYLPHDRTLRIQKLNYNGFAYYITIN